MNTTGGKAYLMVLEDILELAQSADMSSHPRHQVGCLHSNAMDWAKVTRQTVNADHSFMSDW